MNNSIKKGVVVAVILLFVSVSVIPSSGTNVVEKSSNVSFDGNILYVGGSGPGNYTKIQDAIDNASDGDTVFVFNGTYFEFQIKVKNKALNLIGENRNTTVIDAQGKSSVFYCDKDGNTISGFTIRNTSGEESFGLKLRSSYNEIYNNNFSDNRYSCIVIDDEQHHNIIRNNIIRYSLEGIVLRYSSHDIEISENTISDCECGILINSPNHIISQNIITNNDWGIFATHCENTVISENMFTNNEYAIEIDFKSASDSRHTVISGNIFTNNTGYTIFITSISQPYLPMYTEISGNHFVSTGFALYLGGNLNTISHNNFINNTMDAWFIESFYNKWRNNYWNEPRILPLPIRGCLGIFVIPWIQFDWRPAQEPYDIPTWSVI